MKKKGVGSPAYKDYREQKNGRKLLWRIKLKLAMCI